MRLSIKMLLVLGMTLAILVPLQMVRAVIHDRQAYRAQVVASVGRSYAGPQAFAGPVLVVPYTETIEVHEKDSDGVARKQLRKVERRWTFFPGDLVIGGKINPSTRRRGPHQVRVYEWQGFAEASFDAVIPADPEPQHPRAIGRPWLGYAVADVRGLSAAPQLRMDGVPVALHEGLGLSEHAGLHARLDAPEPGQRLAMRTRLQFALGGTESLALVPLGTSNRFQLESAWPHPGFGGSFLPRSHDISDSGFTATWDIASMATRAQAQFLAGEPLPTVVAQQAGDDQATLSDGLDAVGLTLVDPVNVYSQADRASKYGLLFVLLTFVGFFLFELIRQSPIHPIQYGLVGLALAIFFLLLVSLSEHIAFGRAYLVASAACIGLIAFYLSAVLHGTARAAGFAAMLATLYAALYGLLISEDLALVLGAGLLFLVLSAIMVVTRRVEWYAVPARSATAPPAASRQAQAA
ncbi:MAG: cell envelope integrity protein CreD [Pseudomonadota bacterium]|nr:cell envelope integrity protein CreD [Pseudomonadota bacterium]